MAYDRVGVLTRPCHLFVARHSVVEQREVFANLVGVDGRIGLQHAGPLENFAKEVRVVLHGCCFDHRCKGVEFVASEVLDETEVEKCNRAIVVEDVVAGVWVAVKGTHAIQAAEDETEDDLTGMIPFHLGPFEQIGPAEPIDELRCEYPFGAVGRNNLGNADVRMPGVVIVELALVTGLEFVVDLFSEADLDLVDHFGRIESTKPLLE